jgi:hypothetical protein
MKGMDPVVIEDGKEEIGERRDKPGVDVVQKKRAEVSPKESSEVVLSRTAVSPPSLWLEANSGSTAVRSLSATMETSRAASGSATAPEEEAASFVFSEAIDVGLRGKIQPIRERCG